MKFNVLEYLVVGMSPAILCKIINLWNEDRGCDASYERLYDLYEKADFIRFVEVYGIGLAIHYYQMSRFYYDGLNFSKPKPTNVGEMKEFINDELDLDYFSRCIEEFGGIAHWSKIFNTEVIKKLVKEEGKHHYLVK